MNIHDQLSFLNSSKRRRVLTLLDERPASPGELAQQGSISRPTVHRAIAQASDWGWVRSEESGGTDGPGGQDSQKRARYLLSPAGQLVIKAWIPVNELTDKDLNHTSDREQSPKHSSDGPLSPTEVEFLAGSKERERLLEILREGPHTGSDLVADSRLSIGQSMISQTLSTVSDFGWVQQSKEDGLYSLTAAGSKVLDRFTHFAETIEWITSHAREINSFGAIGATLPAHSIVENDGCIRVINAAPGDPDRILNYYADRLAEVNPDSIRGITPAVSSLANQIHRPLLEKEVDVDVVIDKPAYEAAQSAYPEILECATDRECFTLSVYPEEINFGVAVLDERQQAIVSGHERVGVARTCISGTADSFAEWAATTFEKYRAAASLVEEDRDPVV